MKIIQKIFEENWYTFVEKIGYENIRRICHEEVEKIINCGKFENGYLEYTCGSCGEVNRVVFRRDRELLGELPRLVNKVIRYGFKKMNKSEDYTPGIIAVIYTFWMKPLNFDVKIAKLKKEYQQQ